MASNIDAASSTIFIVVNYKSYVVSVVDADKIKGGTFPRRGTPGANSEVNQGKQTFVSSMSTRVQLVNIQVQHCLQLMVC